MPDPIKVAVVKCFRHRDPVSIVDRAITVRETDYLSKVHRLHRNNDFVDCEALESFQKVNALRIVSKRT